MWPSSAREERSSRGIARDKPGALEAALLVVLLRGGDGRGTALAVGRAGLEAQRDQLALHLAHAVMAERQRGESAPCVIRRIVRRLGGGLLRRLLLRVGLLRRGLGVVRLGYRSWCRSWGGGHGIVLRRVALDGR